MRRCTRSAGGLIPAVFLLSLRTKCSLNSHRRFPPFFQLFPSGLADPPQLAAGDKSPLATEKRRGPVYGSINPHRDLTPVLQCGSVANSQKTALFPLSQILWTSGTEWLTSVASHPRFVSGAAVELYRTPVRDVNSRFWLMRNPLSCRARAESASRRVLGGPVPCHCNRS